MKVPREPGGPGNNLTSPIMSLRGTTHFARRRICAGVLRSSVIVSSERALEKWSNARAGAREEQAGAHEAGTSRGQRKLTSCCLSACSLCLCEASDKSHDRHVFQLGARRASAANCQDPRKLGEWVEHLCAQSTLQSSSRNPDQNDMSAFAGELTKRRVEALYGAGWYCHIGSTGAKDLARELRVGRSSKA